MAIRYPNGKKFNPSVSSAKKKTYDYSFSNRGKSLEDELNDTNEYYLAHGLAVIHKKPVPIQIVNVRYPARSAAVITEAYFRTPSTTDYNGVWNGLYVDFEAKETKNKTSLPLQNIHLHQVQHMKQVIDQSGLAFFIVNFTLLDRYFLLPFEEFYPLWQRMEDGGRKSITLSEIEERSIEINTGFHPRLDYIQAVADWIKRKKD
ncbi:Holliday junction resolvase RecU [Sporosarcina sp. P18a]|uniref:Holliday junction resolvase RecU n=1 Tax=unclassified Sporosarcina TaxID=2647733 RepID=UPI000C164912|nr:MULTISPECIES: Holliday junction resolvase RecU [unclassified Sporosarcina]PIC71996.1 Holliday junction resolvase RecU [Sporosarcina sp. P16b]PIC81202.1 Holliday junction resolvase RecU [Sporosarcina sp. P18a]PID02120.1 Holliday junction resolvase RecU [Sporosarcina sp. P2]PID25765.1 Holliday junction resolvase RecU [Sporosarcina sp. P7]